MENLQDLINKMQAFNWQEEFEDIKMQYHDELVEMSPEEQKAFVTEKLGERYEAKTGLKFTPEE